METIKIREKKFKKLVDILQIEEVVSQSQNVINSILQKDSEVVFIVMANGANWFAQKLFSAYENTSLHIEYARLESYVGTSQANISFVSMPAEDDIQGKTVIVVEDILDSGKTMEHFKAWLLEKKVKNIHLIALCKREGNSLSTDNSPLIIAKGEWIVGCGMDYNHCGRNLKHIYTMEKS